ncbi:MAG: hypothetical protein ACI9N1_001420 [Flavobacteriales bacterium]|jgi:hypothetical protein
MKYLFLILVAVSISAVGQQLKQTDIAEITWGEELKMKRGSNYKEVIFANSQNIFLSKWIKSKLYIEQRTTSMTVVTDQKVAFQLDNINLRFEGLFSFGDNFIAMGSYSDKKEKVNSLYYKVISKQDLSNQSSWENVGNITFEKKRRDGDFNYTISSDSTQLLMYFSQAFSGRDTPEKFGFKIFNNKMKLQWSKDIELKYNEELFIVKSFKVDNRGNAYILGKELIETGSEKKSEKYNDVYHILEYSEEGDYQDYEVTLDDRNIKDITIAINQAGDIVCAGFYSENGSFSKGIKGTFYYVIDGKTKKVKTTNFKELGEDFITEDWSDRQIAKAKKKEAKKGQAIEAYEFDLKDLVLKSDGGAIMLAEQYYVRISTTTTTSANGVPATRTTYHYYYNDVYVIDINPEGDIQWASRVDKYQHSTDDGGYRSSYTLHVSDNLYLIYNMRARDHYEREVFKTMSRAEKKSYLTIIAAVNPAGEVKKELLINNSKEEVYVVPKLCSQFSDSKTFIYTNKGAKVTLGILEFK